MNSGTGVKKDAAVDAAGRDPESGVEEAFGRWRPRGIIFDCDGLLMNTESLWGLSQQRVCETLGVVFSAELQRTLVGRPASEIGPLIAAQAGRSASEVLDLLLRVNMDMVMESAVPMPGALTFVQAAAVRVASGVASNSARPILNATLRRGGFHDLFTVVVSADEVRRSKPQPDVYLAAARGLGLLPSECLALEDSETGAAAARAAGMKVVAVPSPGQIPAAHLSRPSLEAPDLLGWVSGWPRTTMSL